MEQQQSRTGIAVGKSDAGSSAEALTGQVPAADKQLIIFYTGDTFSQIEANTSYSPPEGGLPALAHTIAEQQRNILSYVQIRVGNEGGDPQSVRAELDRGLLGGHPLLLLDYGGWERINDSANMAYVSLYFQFFKAFEYSAMATTAVEIAPAGLIDGYMQLPMAPSLLCTVAENVPRGAMRLFSREIHGELWGVASLAYLPAWKRRPENAEENYAKAVEAAAAALKSAGCTRWVLLAPNMDRKAYLAIKGDKRFEVVIGGPGSMAPEPGFGRLEAGPLMLPALNGGGRELGVCHLLYGSSGKPDGYNFQRVKVVEDAQQPYPFRKQCAEAGAARSLGSGKD